MFEVLKQKFKRCYLFTLLLNVINIPLVRKLNYINMNPVIDKIVEKPEDYLFSSARNYADINFLVEVLVLPHKLKTVN